MMPLSRGLSSGRTLARGHREACCGLKNRIFHPHDSTKTRYFIGLKHKAWINRARLRGAHSGSSSPW